MSRLLNFGCGDVFHAEWVNLDALPADPRVLRHDVRRGLPFSDASFDAVYGSHVLEHLTPCDAERLVADCFRVLAPGGIARLVVPDLETIARLYLQSLEAALAGDEEARWRYDWMLLELYDQTVRTTPRGRMGETLSATLDEWQRRFIVERIGEEAQARPPARRRNLLRRAFRAARREAASLCAFALLGEEGRQALRDGLLRRSGVVHQWMYDRFSLKRALEAAGFVSVRVCAADDSSIPDFPRYGLETSQGLTRKPDSLYMEGRKSARAAESDERDGKNR